MQFIVLSRAGDSHPESFAKDNGYSMLFGKDIDGFATFGFKAIPSTAFIDAEGKLVDQHTGALDAAQLAEAIQQIL